MTTTNTIVFGPTGKVGSEVARSAQKHGAKVFLAMRDPQKPIPGLSPEQEQAGGFERVRADLTQPETIQAAVAKTRAKSAFVYIVFGSPDNLRSGLEALQSAGIEFVVFLSSDGIRGNLRSIAPSSFVAWAHAQVEINLEEVFGKNGYVAVRPAYFATNALWWKKMAREGNVKLLYPEAKFDWITARDIGRVSGALLAGGPQAARGHNFIRLAGPELVSLRDAVRTISRVVGTEIGITELDEQQGLDMYVNSYGLPEPVAKQLLGVMKARAENDTQGGNDELFEGYKEAAENVQKYTGKKPTTLQEWAEENQQEFVA